MYLTHVQVLQLAEQFGATPPWSKEKKITKAQPATLIDCLEHYIIPRIEEAAGTHKKLRKAFAEKRWQDIAQILGEFGQAGLLGNNLELAYSANSSLMSHYHYNAAWNLVFLAAAIHFHSYQSPL